MKIFVFFGEGVLVVKVGEFVRSVVIEMVKKVFLSMLVIFLILMF